MSESAIHDSGLRLTRMVERGNRRTISRGSTRIAPQGRLTGAWGNQSLRCNMRRPQQAPPLRCALLRGHPSQAPQTFANEGGLSRAGRPSREKLTTRPGLARPFASAALRERDACRHPRQNFQPRLTPDRATIREGPIEASRSKSQLGRACASPPPREVVAQRVHMRGMIALMDGRGGGGTTGEAAPTPAGPPVLREDLAARAGLEGEEQQVRRVPADRLPIRPLVAPFGQVGDNRDGRLRLGDVSRVCRIACPPDGRGATTRSSGAIRNLGQKRARTSTRLVASGADSARTPTSRIPSCSGPIRLDQLGTHEVASLNRATVLVRLRGLSWEHRRGLTEAASC